MSCKSQSLELYHATVVESDSELDLAVSEACSRMSVWMCGGTNITRGEAEGRSHQSWFVVCD
jgi:hypothetical protein